MKWRPAKYYPIATEVINNYNNEEIGFSDLIEGIIDAVLDGLKAEGTYIPPTPWKGGILLSGWQVLIPDEEEKQ